MATPLVMLGPGGDYTTTLDVKGRDLQRNARPLDQNAGDNESAGSFATWARTSRKRRRPGQESVASEPIRGQADSFEHAAEQPDAGTYNAHGSSHGRRPAPNQPSLIAALLAWLTAQCQVLDELAYEHDEVRAELADSVDPAQDEADDIRIIPWTSPRSPLRPIRFGPNHNPYLAPEVRPDHDHAQPDAQTNEDPHPHPRHPLVARLFPHHAGTGRRTRRVQGHHLRARRSPHQKGLPDPSGEQGALFGG